MNQPHREGESECGNAWDCDAVRIGSDQLQKSARDFRNFVVRVGCPIAPRYFLKRYTRPPLGPIIVLVQISRTILSLKKKRQPSLPSLPSLQSLRCRLAASTAYTVTPKTSTCTRSASAPPSAVSYISALTPSPSPPATRRRRTLSFAPRLFIPTVAYGILLLTFLPSRSFLYMRPRSRTSRHHHSPPHHKMSDNESIATVEAAVEARLSAWASPSDSNIPHNTVKRRRKRQKQPHKPQKPPPPPLHPTPPPSHLLQSSLSASAAAIEARLLKRTLIRPRDSPPPKLPVAAAVPAFSPSNASKFTRARSSFENKSKPQQQKGEQNTNLVDAVQFVESHRREVNHFGATALHKRDRKAFETTERVRLGCRPPKPQKMPIGLLQAMRRNQKAREENQRQLDIASGMLIRCKRRK